MADERLQDRIARLERERHDADRDYNQALTGVDRATLTRPDLPHPPPPYDETMLGAINSAWDILPSGAPPVDGSLKGRLRGFVWRLIGPALETQRRFNSALVDHLNRNAAAHREAAKAAATTIELIGHHVDRLIEFQSRLVQYLQTVTLYVDTRDRQVGGQALILNEGLSAISDDWLKRWESLAAREQRFMSRVSDLDDLRVTASLAQQATLTLKREVERLLEHASAISAGQKPAGPPPDLESFKYVGFEEAFRGSPEEIRRRLASYLPHFEGLSDVLDIGCGRGEFLELLRERGISARGLDLNHEMAEASRARGLDVVEADALTYLRNLEDASIGGLFAAQVVEHLEPAYLMQLLETALHKIRPGGAIVLETINTACWVAFFESYIRDLTHVRPLHPETLQYLLRASGFHGVTIEYRSPVPDAERLQPVLSPPGLPAEIADFVETINSNVEKLNSRLYTHMDYAVIAHR
ncbi:MAG TPA: class I SAM-dependent methyltransferase [Vicinamibacterales bacterium]|nr:class I SAM-dependent methyltransferase [Vicinamibacterales bacterium]